MLLLSRKILVTILDKNGEMAIFPFVMNVQEKTRPLADSYSRTVSYLRFSVTDRCNLHCVYCRGLGDVPVLHHNELLRYEEIIRLVRIAVGLGINKVRLTGGEPFARRDCDALILGLREEFPDLNLRITTNGTLLPPHMDTLFRARVNAVNISLDSFRSETFQRITGSDKLATVLSVIDELVARGMRVKINAVAMKGITDLELPAFLEATARWPIDVRFIEFMPMGAQTIWEKDRFLSAGDILRTLGTMGHLTPVENARKDHGPARMFTVEGHPGRIGVISALSNHFCDSCNRLRITSDGNLRTCLFADAMTPLRDLLRNPQISDDDVAEVIRKALANKPVGAELLRQRRKAAVAAMTMDSIGG